MGVGFDADIARRFNNLPRRGLPNYVRAGLQAFREFRAETVTLSGGDWSSTAPRFVTSVANSAQYGNGALIAPGAAVDDGQLDLVAVPPIGTLTALGLVGRLFTGSFTASPRVLHRRGAEFRIQRSTSGCLHVDGETRDAGPEIVVRVLPRSLRIVVPAV
jgi:diacylglycerol kinase family enzyme